MSHEQSNSKSSTVAYLLWFFLGGFGAHRFYFGKMKSGLGMLGLFFGSMVLSVVFIGLLGYVALTAWWIYDAIQIGKWLKGEDTPATVDAVTSAPGPSPVMAPPAPVEAEPGAEAA